MIGAIQAENMALALLRRRDRSPLERGRRGARPCEGFLPARFQILSLNPPVVLDGAHTPYSVRLALDSFAALYPGPKALLFACAETRSTPPWPWRWLPSSIA